MLSSLENLRSQIVSSYRVWDETLAKSAEAWAATCIWDHGPSYLLRFLGQNLSVRTGRYRSILQLVKPWYDEVKDYAFPYPQDCNPRCPMRCYGPMCTHYTQMVWATSNRIGCAIHTCHNMNVWGSVLATSCLLGMQLCAKVSLLSFKYCLLLYSCIYHPKLTSGCRNGSISWLWEMFDLRSRFWTSAS
uniref:Uncharacterized protein n=1 Tax=Melopsittacus undulatus TaxID=13146 RepID=A0A8V5GIN4_MELUD